MRIVFTAAAALAVLMAAGCDINTGPAREAKVDCHCTAVAPPAAPIAEAAAPGHRHRWYHHAYSYGGSYAGHRGYAWRREYSEVSVATYDYRSDSHSYVMGETDDETGGASAYADGAAHGGGGAQGWVDGHGRDYGGAAMGDAVHHESESSDAARMKPWHGYDVDCPDPNGRH